MDLSATLDEIKKLDVSDRLWLAHAIWESVGDDELPGELTDVQKDDLGRRMRELEENPSIGLTWEQLMERLRSRQRVPRSSSTREWTTTCTKLAPFTNPGG